MSISSKNKFQQIDHNSWAWKAYLAYDILMMLVILINVFCIIGNSILMSHFAEWLSTHSDSTHLLSWYRSEIFPWVKCTEVWFICFLIAELSIRWIVAIIQHHHQRWFFFPFIHWYEILAIFPALRFLRLFRAGIIAYRLHEIGYNIIPQSWLKTGRFYYNVLMEELSDRVVISVIDGVKSELDTSSTHKKIIHDLVDHHRTLFAKAIAELLQESLATELKNNQIHLSRHMGLIVQNAIDDIPELHQTLRLLPIVGSRIEGQIQNISKRLGENITNGVLAELTSGSIEQPNPMYQFVAKKLSEVNIDNHTLEVLVESAVYESLESMRKQVKVKQWQLMLKASDQAKP